MQDVALKVLAVPMTERNQLKALKKVLYLISWKKPENGGLEPLIPLLH